MIKDSLKLGVCWIWTSPFVWTKSVASMLQLERPRGYEVQFFQGTGWCPASRHINACKGAIDWGADLLLILGADQVYQTDLLTRLVKRWEEGYEIISALVPTRGYVSWQNMKPFQPMAWRLQNSETPLEWSPDNLVVVDPAEGDVQEIDFIGSGVIMFERNHLLALKEPWFFETIDPRTQRRLACMDTKFAHRLKNEAHARLYVDTTIQVRHLHAFEVDHSFQERFPDWERPGAGDPSICMYEEIAPQSAEA
jgi:hypothetical protein